MKMHHHLLLASCLLNAVFGAHVGGHISGEGHRLDVHTHRDVLKKLSAEEVKLLKMMTSQEKDVLKKMSSAEEKELIKELDILIENMDDKQLQELVAVIGKDLDNVSEFDQISEVLVEMGLEEDDIEDLKLLAEMMHEFLAQVDNINAKLEMSAPKDLMDNIQLYLLGLPNKLGPLGFMALHHVLEAEEEEASPPVPAAVVLKPTTTTQRFRRAIIKVGGHGGH